MQNLATALQVFVDFFSQRSTDPVYFCQVIDARIANALQPAELP